MSNIATITIDGITYDIKDAPARSDISDLQTTVGGIQALTDSTFYNALIDTLYPVGSIYISMNDSAPFSRGTWTKVGSGRAIAGVNTGGAFDGMKTPGGTYGYADGSLLKHNHSASGGSHTHGMSHNHVLASSGYRIPTFNASSIDSECSKALTDGDYKFPRIPKAKSWTSVDGTTNASSISSTGSATPSISIGQSSGVESLTNRNYQPTISVYIWERTA